MSEEYWIESSKGREAGPFKTLREAEATCIWWSYVYEPERWTVRL